MASRILGMGDVLTLIEQAEKAFDADQAEEMAGKLRPGEDFTLEDFLAQMQAVRKMGSMSKLLGMLPGMGQMREQIDNIDEREIDRVTAIIQSMTPAERARPEDPQRLAPGAHRPRARARTVSDVNSLVDRFFEAQKMMRQLACGGGHARDARACPGMGRRRQEVQGQGAGQAGKKGGKSAVGQPGQARAAGARRRPPAQAGDGAPRRPAGGLRAARRAQGPARRPTPR